MLQNLEKYNSYSIIRLLKNNMEILNMLNVKYIIQTNKEGKEFHHKSNANGNAWFVNDVVKLSGQSNY
jgi:Mg2+/Co2+ transporter CorB